MLVKRGYKLQILWKVHWEYSRNISDIRIENAYNIEPDFAYLADCITQQCNKNTKFKESGLVVIMKIEEDFIESL